MNRKFSNARRTRASYRNHSMPSLAQLRTTIWFYSPDHEIQEVDPVTIRPRMSMDSLET